MSEFYFDLSCYFQESDFEASSPQTNSDLEEEEEDEETSEPAVSQIYPVIKK